jgi:hypothetical protein
MAAGAVTRLDTGTLHQLGAVIAAELSRRPLQVAGEFRQHARDLVAVVEGVQHDNRRR